MQTVIQWNNDSVAGETNRVQAEEDQRIAPQKQQQAPFPWGTAGPGLEVERRGDTP